MLMRKTVSTTILIILIASLLSGCQTNQNGEHKKYIKYSDNFFGTFDTLVQVIGYTETKEEFNSYVKKIEIRFRELHKLYDI
ncbi:MAG: FAD:protein FMN transferase, partial [Alkaliphilus sp.]|nr:FAD:protein FMN transferase [Alkaliphilus sp.]